VVPAGWCHSAHLCIHNFLTLTLQQRFGERLISKNGTVAWPHRSPDLADSDFFLWGYVKYKVYREPMSTMEELKAKNFGVNSNLAYINSKIGLYGVSHPATPQIDFESANEGMGDI